MGENIYVGPLVRDTLSTTVPARAWLWKMVHSQTGVYPPSATDVAKDLGDVEGVSELPTFAIVPHCNDTQSQPVTSTQELAATNCRRTRAARR